jgi:hypothetical protein
MASPKELDPQSLPAPTRAPTRIPDASRLPIPLPDGWPVR